jgi:DNA-directed RNA polymerase subunit RPC12/RpoP
VTEYRCLGCGYQVRAERPVALYCVKCEKIMHRWQ